MTEKERMEQGSIYNPNVSELTDEQSIYMEKLWEFNQLRPSEQDKKQKYMKEVFAECGEDCFIELPFRANWGGKNLHFGNRVYANFNLTVVGDGEIFVGDKVMFGPNVTIATANHPIDPSLREDAMQYNKSVTYRRKCLGWSRYGDCSGRYYRKEFCNRSRKRSSKRHSGECGRSGKSVPRIT